MQDAWAKQMERWTSVRPGGLTGQNDEVPDATSKYTLEEDAYGNIPCDQKTGSPLRRKVVSAETMANEGPSFVSVTRSTCRAKAGSANMLVVTTAFSARRPRRS